MFPQLGPVGPGLTAPLDLRPDPPEPPRANRVEPLTSGRQTADLPTLPDRASDRALEVARLNRPDQRLGPPDAISPGSTAPDPVDLNPPDPDAPAGPPPAFEASILDRAREDALAPPPVDASGTVAQRPVTGDDTSVAIDLAETVGPLLNPYAAPPTAEKRASEEVATLRRIETPYDTATVDVSR